MRPLSSHATRLLTAGFLAASFGLASCKSVGLVVDPPAVTPGAGGVPICIGDVVDARVFTTQSTAAPVPSTRGDAGDPSWTRRVFGRRRAGMRTLGSDRFTLDPRGVPALVEAALAGFEEPVPLRAQGSVLSGAADGVAWRNAVRRTLDDLAVAMAEAVAAGEAGDTESRRTAP